MPMFKVEKTVSVELRLSYEEMLVTRDAIKRYRTDNEINQLIGNSLADNIEQALTIARQYMGEIINEAPRDNRVDNPAIWNGEAFPPATDDSGPQAVAAKRK